MMTFKSFVLVGALSSVLVACGGGGGSSNTSSDTTPTPTPTPTPVDSGSSSLYTGNRQVATVTAANYKVFVDGMMASNTRIKNLAALLKSPFGDAKAHTSNPLWTTNDTGACAGGGTVTATSTFNDTTGIGEMRYTYNQCVVDALTANGSYLLNINKYAVAASGSTYSITDFTINYIDLMDTTAGVTENPQGSIHLKSLDTATGSESTSNLVFSNSLGVQRWDNNLVFNSTPLGTKIVGALCDSVHGCVTVATSAPYNGLTSGNIVLTGAANSKARLRMEMITPRNGTPMLELDANGDGTYEVSTKYTN